VDETSPLGYLDLLPGAEAGPRPSASTTFPSCGRRMQIAGYLVCGESADACISRSLMARSALILLDEPSLGLSRSWSRISSASRKITRRRKTTMRRGAERERVAVYRSLRLHHGDGRIVLDGEPEKLKSKRTCASSTWGAGNKSYNAFSRTGGGKRGLS